MAVGRPEYAPLSSQILAVPRETIENYACLSVTAASQDLGEVCSRIGDRDCKDEQIGLSQCPSVCSGKVEGVEHEETANQAAPNYP